MAHADRYESLQRLQNQGLFQVNERGFFRGLYLEFWAWPGLLLSYFFGICFSIKCSQILVIAGRLPHDEEAIADPLVFILVPLTLLGVPGMKRKLESACHPGRHAILLLTGSLGLLMITGARAELENEADIRSCICADPNVWEIRDYVLEAVAVAILAGMATIGVAVAERMFNLRPLVRTIPAIPAIPAAVQALPIIPVVQGDDIDDVLARAPIPTRLNSPLSWLEIVV